MIKLEMKNYNMISTEKQDKTLALDNSSRFTKILIQII